MKHVLRKVLAAGICALLLLSVGSVGAYAQQETKWMAAGSLNNWFSNLGCEIEEGRISPGQQDGLQWPAWYRYQDSQAAKGFWIGAVDYIDANNFKWDYKVVHIGPRGRGTGEFYPVKFEMVSKYPPPAVLVNGSPSEGKAVENNRVDPTQKADRMIINETNTAIGITMVRKIMQFSNQYHDNYMIFDYTFTNTGNTNGDAAIELPAQTVKGVYFYWLYRYSVCMGTRYVIGNGTSWGMNAMNDARGDGYKLPTTNAEDTDDAVNIPEVGYSSPHMRAQFTWHGKFPATGVTYDNVGGPIWVPPPASQYGDPADTVGRLGAAQFVGHVTIHADKSPTDPTDDVAQPRTTSWEGSDEDIASGNDQFNLTRMTKEYSVWMTRGHLLPRHAWAVEPQGKFTEPTGNPSFVTAHAVNGGAGGFSNADGFGPYTLAPGQSVHIVIAEGMSGLSRQACITYGRQFKAGQITAKQKNEYVLTGKDSLFNTFRRAIANYKTNYGIPAAPPPPSSVSAADGDPISIAWEVENASDPNVRGFRVFRALGRYDGEYVPIRTAGPTERSYNDATAQRGVAYFYYVVTIGDPALNTGVGLTPKDTLFSNRVYTQTFNPVYLKPKRPPGQTMSDIRIVPNPFILTSDAANLRFPDEPDKIAFYNIPGRCKIKVYTELGELITEIDHTDGSGDAYWNSITSDRQVIVSGIYIVVFEDLDTGLRSMQKLSIIR